MASTPQANNEAVSSEAPADEEVAATTIESPVAQQAAQMMGVKHPGVLQSVEVDVVITLQFNDTRFRDQKANLLAVELEEGTRNMYVPFKRDKKNEAGNGVMRYALPQIIEAVNQVNSNKLMILSESRAAISKGISMMVENLAQTARVAITGMADDVALVSTDETSLQIKDYVKVGTWNTPVAVGPVTQNASCVGITMQVPELYDSELKINSVNRIFKYLLNLLNKSGAEVSILLAVAVNPAMMEDEQARDFIQALFDENWAYYTRFDLIRNEGKETWIPKAKMHIEKFLLPTDGATFGTEMLFVKAVQEDDDDGDDAVESAE